MQYSTMLAILAIPKGFWVLLSCIKLQRLKVMLVVKYKEKYRCSDSTL